MIVGESRYEWLDERWERGDLLPPGTTKEIVNEIAEEAYRKAHWTKIAISFLGLNPPRNPRGPMFDFWHSVSYYNFVQECPGKNSSARPSHEAFEPSLKGFATVLADLKPRLVLVYSHST